MILVTGGTGFMGFHLVEALLRQGRKVRILDNLSTGKIENLEEATGHRVAHLEGRAKSPWKVPLLYGDGSQSRDITYVGNVARANLLAMKATAISDRVFNIACGQRISVNDLLGRLQEISGIRIPARFEPARNGEVRHSLSSICQAQTHLGYEPQIGFQEGLTATWAWFREKGV